MQEEVENRTLTLVVSGTKFTGRLFSRPEAHTIDRCSDRRCIFPLCYPPYVDLILR